LENKENSARQHFLRHASHPGVVDKKLLEDAIKSKVAGCAKLSLVA
jgi:hypothetical protein